MFLVSCVSAVFLFCFFFKQKTAYEMRISDWSSDVCSSDLGDDADPGGHRLHLPQPADPIQLGGAAMTEQAIAMQPRESRVLRFAKGLALIRESWVGMIGLGIILFWSMTAIFADVLAPFPPNATGIPMALPGGASLDGRAIHYLGTDRKSTRLNSSH